MPSLQKLYEGQPPTSETTLFTAPTPAVGVSKTQVDHVVAVNTTGAAATFSLSIVPAGNVAGAANRIFAAQSVAANSEVNFPIDEELTSGDFISGLQGTSGAITLHINGN